MPLAAKGTERAGQAGARAASAWGAATATARLGWTAGPAAATIPHMTLRTRYRVITVAFSCVSLDAIQLHKWKTAESIVTSLHHGRDEASLGVFAFSDTDCGPQ